MSHVPIPSRFKSSGRLAKQKWLTMIALPILIVTMLYEIYGVWGALFVFWGISSLLDGEAYLIEPIQQRRNPILFWVIVTLWIGSGLLYVYADLARYM
ncbi:MAG: hypothetical protein ACR2O4_04140 [Hyphomicrobiaceae bacterium]